MNAAGGGYQCNSVSWSWRSDGHGLIAQQLPADTATKTGPARLLWQPTALGNTALLSFYVNCKFLCQLQVGEFKSLALRAESDGHLRQQLQALLKLAKEKWDEAAEHAKRAVVPDNRMRAWYADRSTLDLGLLFPCRLGVVDLKRPEGRLQTSVTRHILAGDVCQCMCWQQDVAARCATCS
eukprot:GHRR01035762.1.p1 GENE.GHRR01035762.1~~GHRR01035762.1.p1  ORF type:complete len:210 (-),score=68.29 GHRR01035762.1:242-784(-)